MTAPLASSNGPSRLTPLEHPLCLQNLEKGGLRTKVSGRKKNRVYLFKGRFVRENLSRPDPRKFRIGRICHARRWLALGVAMAQWTIYKRQAAFVTPPCRHSSGAKMTWYCHPSEALRWSGGKHSGPFCCFDRAAASGGQRPEEEPVLEFFRVALQVLERMTG